MSLKDLCFKYSYRSDQNKLYKDFFEPCLENSIKYDRAAGYFTSDSLKFLAKGLETFLYNDDSKIRIVSNPHLTSDDVKAIEMGEQDQWDVIDRAMYREITADLIENDTLNILAWLISQKKIEFKIAFTPRNKLYHEKFGIFTDHENKSIAFNGSANATAGGLSENFEKIEVFFEDYESNRINSIQSEFDRLWANETNGLEVRTMSNKIKDKILSYKKKTMPHASKINAKSNVPKPRTYQTEAINKLKNNDWHGILEMATGTGKTITSLLAAQEYQNINNRAFMVIIVPYAHLITQWKKECQNIFPDIQPLLCYKSKQAWKYRLDTAINNFNSNIVKEKIILTTYKTAGSDDFKKRVSEIKKNGLLISDECHRFGTQSFRNVKWNNIKARIGLSATPRRWWDDDGSKYINDFFGGSVYSYSLDEAIEDNKLTPYEYKPIIVHPTDSEIDRYEKLTRQIIRVRNSDDVDEDKLSELNRRRSLIIARLDSKIPTLIEIFREKVISKVNHTLIYCAPKQVSDITHGLYQLGLRVHKFTSEVSNDERMKILNSFADGNIQVLVAIKCLDEGVDVPSTQQAYFLASTSNPREFVQRRGRILRKAPAKTMAYIYDFVALPEYGDETIYETFAKKELPRFAEFANSAINSGEAKNEMARELSHYHLDNLMYRKPWDVYEEMRKEIDW